MKQLFNFFLILMYVQSFGQKKVYENFEIGEQNSQKTEILKLISDYYNKVNAAQIFTQYDQLNYKSIDLASFSTGFDGGLLDIVYKINVLSINKIGSNYMAKNLLYWEDEQSKNITVLAIQDLHIINDNGKWKISNFLNHQIKDWHSIEIGKIKYFYNQSHSFNEINAIEANNFLDKLLKKFKINSDVTLKYFIAENCNDVKKLNGFEYLIGESQTNLCAFYDNENDIVYTSTAFGEKHLHELIHVLNKFFPQANDILKIGLSSYINDASSKNLPITFHFKNLNNYLLTSKLDFENFENLTNLDQFTTISYVTGYLICNAIYRKGGIELLIDYLNKIKTTEELKVRLKKDFKFNNFESFFMNELQIFKAQKKSLLYIE